MLARIPLGLRLHIIQQLALGTSTGTALYARHCSIVQSSGMGKSLLLDEFSKKYFLIPVMFELNAQTRLEWMGYDQVA